MLCRVTFVRSRAAKIPLEATEWLESFLSYAAVDVAEMGHPETDSVLSGYHL